LGKDPDLDRIQIGKLDSDIDDADPQHCLGLMNTKCQCFGSTLDSFFLFFFNIFLGDFFLFFSAYIIQHCFICRPSDSTVPTDAGIEPRTVATGALAVRRSNH
jgi:hypothetical protein